MSSRQGTWKDLSYHCEYSVHGTMSFTDGDLLFSVVVVCIKQTSTNLRLRPSDGPRQRRSRKAGIVSESETIRSDLVRCGRGDDSELLRCNRRRFSQRPCVRLPRYDLGQRQLNSIHFFT